jgi:hypothetical protein
MVKFVDPWTLADMRSAIRESRELLTSVDHTVDVIWDGTETGGAPSNLFSHFMFPNEDTDIPENQGAVIVVVQTSFLRSFAALGKRLLPRITRNMHITTNLPAAEAKIEALRAGR